MLSFAVIAASAAPPGWRLSLTVYPPAPSLAKDSVTMTSISAPGADDVWAIGSVQPPTNADTGRPVLEHWNGRGWQGVTLPGSFISSQETFQIAASSASDVWVFSSAAKGKGAPQWARWNGHSWTAGRLPAPAVTTRNGAIDVTAAVAAGPDDIWVGGDVFTAAFSANYDWAPFLLNWNGRAWRTYTSLPPSTAISGISALSPTDIWASSDGGGPGNQLDLLLHWNGSSWHSIPVPADLQGAQQSPFFESEFRDVVGESPHSAWVVGEVPLPGHYVGYEGAGAAYWNGSRWTIAGIGALYPDAASPYPLASAVSDGSGGLWAVSQIPDGGNPPTELWHYSHARWTRVPLPTLASDLVSAMAATPGGGSVWAAAYSQRPGATPGQIFSYRR
jgi:hypothetical protein